MLVNRPLIESMTVKISSKEEATTNKTTTFFVLLEAMFPSLFFQELLGPREVIWIAVTSHPPP